MIRVYATTNMRYTPFYGFHKIDLPYLKDNNIEIVQDAKEADVIVSQHFKQLKPMFLKYWNSKKYLVWTLEPRFNTYSQSIKSFYIGLMKCHVMNIYTGDVFVSPLSYHIKNIDKRLQYLSPDFDFKNKLLVGLMSFYKGLDTEAVMFNNQDVDLIKKRTQIALYGHEHKKMHVYGKGWPVGMSREDSRDGNWTETKKGILDKYHFNLCFENTVAPRYTTEKIWDSIENYCLPVYYGKGSHIYDLFPQDSFIDYSLIHSPDKLFKVINEISQEEYVDRMNKCIDVYNGISSYSEEKKHEERKKSLYKLVLKIQEITGQ